MRTWEYRKQHIRFHIQRNILYTKTMTALLYKVKAVAQWQVEMYKKYLTAQ